MFPIVFGGGGGAFEELMSKLKMKLISSVPNGSSYEPWHIKGHFKNNFGMDVFHQPRDNYQARHHAGFISIFEPMEK